MHSGATITVGHRWQTTQRTASWHGQRLKGNRTHGNTITNGCTDPLFEGILTAAVKMKVEPGIFDQHTRTHQGASDAMDEGLNQAIEFDVSRCRYSNLIKISSL